MTKPRKTPFAPYIPSQTLPVVRLSRQRSRPGQKEFRKALLKRDGACVITSCTNRAMLDAAHIKPFTLCRELAEYNDLDNGLVLRADIHKAFDRGHWTISSAGTLVIRRGATDIPRHAGVLKLNTRQLKYLAGHRKWYRTRPKINQEET